MTLPIWTNFSFVCWKWRHLKNEWRFDFSTFKTKATCKCWWRYGNEYEIDNYFKMMKHFSSITRRCTNIFTVIPIIIIISCQHVFHFYFISSCSFYFLNSSTFLICWNNEQPTNTIEYSASVYVFFFHSIFSSASTGISNFNEWLWFWLVACLPARLLDFFPHSRV